MSNAVYVALGLQWVILIVMALAILALMRQVGVLHARFGPVPGALMISKGVKIGERSPEFRLRTVDSREVIVGNVDAEGRSTLVMFVAPECPVCAKLMPALKSIGAQEASWLRLVFASDGEVEPQQKFWREKGLDEYPYVLSHELGMSYEIGRLPYGVLIDAKGMLVAQGLCNSREHVESLFEAQRLGVGSIQEYMQREEQRAKTRPAI